MLPDTNVGVLVQIEKCRRTAFGSLNMFIPNRLGDVEKVDFDYSVRDTRLFKGTRPGGLNHPNGSSLKKTFFEISGTRMVILVVQATGTLKTNPRLARPVLNQHQVLVFIPDALDSICEDGWVAWFERGVAHLVQGGDCRTEPLVPSRLFALQRHFYTEEFDSNLVPRHMFVA